MMILKLILLMNVFCLMSAKMQVDRVEAEAIRLRLRGGSHNDQGLEGESTWYCKRMREPEDSYSPHPSNNVFFVQPHSKKYRHELTLDMSHDSPPNTTIYVLPSKHEHEIELHTAENGAAVSKPSFFFLKNHPLEINKSVSSSTVSIASTATEYNNSPPVPPARIHPHFRQGRTLSRIRDRRALRRTRK